ALERLLDISLQLEGIECGGVYLADIESGAFHLKAHRGVSESFVERVSGYEPDAPEARAAKTGRALYMRQEEIPRSLRVFWGGEGLGALAMVPLRHHGVTFGMLALGSYQAQEILGRTRMAIEMLAAQVAGALARIRAEDAFRRSDIHLRTIIKSAPIALLATDAQGKVAFADGRALPAMGGRPGQHVGRPVAELFTDFPLALANLGRASAGEEFTSVLEFADTALECRYTPMRDQRRNYAGFVIVATDVTELFRLQREILEISDREQARIGHDIHDGLCQQLIGLAFKLNTLQHALGCAQHPETANARRACELLDEAITESRRVSRGLYPIRLTTLGLLPALEDLAANATER
ncbi:MAG: PAS domain-containing protein, partial [Limisphaerales bacterium]